MCSTADQCIRFRSGTYTLSLPESVTMKSTGSKGVETVINQELDYVTENKGVRVIYILHKTLSPLKFDAAEPTGDRRLR